MYDQLNSENDDFNRMQQKIKDTIDSMVTDTHVYNPANNSSPDNTNVDNNNNNNNNNAEIF